MKKPDPMAAISRLCKCLRETLRPMVRVDEKLRHADVDQMVQRESDEWLLENRHQRLGKIVRQRPEPSAQSSAEDECLCDRSHGANNLSMAEETIWRGSVSQWKNLGFFILQAVFAAAIVVIFVLIGRRASPEVRNFSPYILVLLALPIFIAGKRYLQTKCTVYELTNERLKTTEGVFSKVTDTLELYRVKDIETRQPFVYRLGGIENVQLNTSDSSSPVVSIEAVAHRVGFADKIRNQVEAIRQQKGVREIDVE
jgi:membrane protein YdbS with pleckstrin-like domain